MTIGRNVGKIANHLLFTLLALVALGSGTEAWGVTDLPVFGPKRYERTQGKPPVYVDRFDRCEPSDLALLRVWNGDSKESRVEAARIHINGALVAQENEFQKKTPYFEKLISVEKVNELRVEVKAGDFKIPAFLEIEVVGKNCDAIPPVISEPQPADSSLLNIARPTISALFADEANGSGIDTASIRLTLDGSDVTAAAAVSESDIRYSPTALPEGVHLVTLEVSDRAFNVARHSWRFTTDTVPPQVTIDAPVDGVFLNTPQIGVSGSVNEPVLSVLLDGRPAAVAGGSFQATGVSLAEGENLLEAVATDLAGNVGRAEVRVNLDTVPPLIQITSHAPDSFLNTPVITIDGTVDEPVIALSVNGASVPPTQAFSLAGLTLAEGGNTVVVAAIDRAGNESTLALPLVLDTIAPQVTIAAPLQGFLTNVASVNLAGSVSEADTTVTVNGRPGTVDGQSFSFTGFPLTEGGNTLAVTATDRAGNSGLASVTGTLDTVPPAPPVLDPPLSPTNVPVTAMAGSAEPLSLLQVSARGPGGGDPEPVGTVQADAQGRFSLGGLILGEGTTLFTAVATDAAGNTGAPSTPATVVLDTVPPQIIVLTPTDGAWTNQPAVQVTGSVNEPVASVTVNGQAAGLQDLAFTLSVALLQEGENPLVVAAIDLAGNSAAVPVRVNLDTVPPLVLLIAPESGLLTNRPQVDVAGTVNEPVTAVTVNGSAALVDGLSFSLAAFPLMEEENLLIAVATDRAGNTGSAEVLVDLDSIPPAAPLLTAPSTPTRVAQTEIAGTAEAASRVKIFALYPGAAEPALIGTLSADPAGPFHLPAVPLLEGTTVFTATATDAAGNESPSSASVAVLLDTVPPAITIASPADQSYSDGTRVRIIGSVDDPEATFLIGETAVPLADGAFDFEADLQPGENSLLFTATDLAGNVGTATLTLHVDNTPPTVTILAPLPDTLTATPRLGVAGSVDEPVTAVTVNGVAATVEGFSFTLASLDLAEGENTLTVTAVDRAGNTGTAEVKVTVDSQPPTASLTAPAEAAAGATISLGLNATDNRALQLVEVRADGVPFWSAAPASSSLGQSLAYALSPDLPAGREVNLEARAADKAGNQATARTAVTISQGPSGPGYLQGEVYDDRRGLWLEGAEVSVIGQSGDWQAITQEDGGYLFELPAGDYLVAIARPGYTAVERQVAVRPEKTTTVLDARLTPIDSQSQQVGFAAALVKKPLEERAGGAWIAGGSPVLELTLPESSLVEDLDLRLTPVSNQGLAAPLPAGWSPIAAVDLRFLTLGGEPFPGEVAFYFPASLRLPLAQAFGLPAASEVLLARYDAAAHRWLAESPALVGGDGASVTASLPRDGEYALLLPDFEPAPPAPLAGQPLAGAVPASAGELTASGQVVPPVAPPEVGLQAVGEVVLAAGDASPISSGTVLRGRVTERFDLLSGEVVQPSEYVQDLVLYRYPCVTGSGAGEAGSEAAPEALRTTFPVTPSRDYTITELMAGKVGIEIAASAAAETSGTLVGADGALLLDGDGNSLAIPAGALGRTVPVATRTVPAAVAGAAVGADFTLLRAVEVNFTRERLSASAELSTPAPASLDPTLPVLLARAIDVGGARKLKLVAWMRQAGSLLTSQTLHPSGIPLEGIRTSDVYYVLQAKAPLGFVRGQVKDAAGAPFASALVTVDTCSLADFTGSDGRYLAAARVAPFTAAALDLARYDAGSAAATMPAAGQAVGLDLTVRATPPAVVSVSPADGAAGIEPNAAVTVTFSEPVDRTTITGESLLLRGAGGQALPGVFSFNPGETAVTFYPAAALASETEHIVTVSGAIRDRQGYPLGQDVVARFTVRDTTPPPRPPAGAITATFPDEEGFITVTGTRGSAEPECTVLLINDFSGEIASAAPLSDGSFTGRLRAQLGDEVQVALLDAAGNQTVITYITFRSDDGRYLVTARGGKVEGEGGLLLDIPEGALAGPAVVKITPVLESALPHPVPTEGNFLAAVNVDTGGVRFLKEVKLSIPVPDDYPEVAFPFLATPREHTNPDGTVEKIYEIVDTVKVIDGRLTTASPPFVGVNSCGIFSFFFLPNLEVAIISGTTYRDMDDVGGYTPGVDLPVRGAVIRSPQAWNFVSYSRDNGFYSVLAEVYDQFGVSGKIDITAIHPMTMNRVSVSLPTKAPLLINNLNFRLADSTTKIEDKIAPDIRLGLQVAPGEDARIISGAVPVGTDLDFSIEVIDQQIKKVTAGVEYRSDDNKTIISHPPQIMLGKTELHTPSGDDGRPAIWRYSYKSSYPAPVAGEQGFFRPDVPGNYVFSVEAEDEAGHLSIRKVSIRVIADGGMPDSIPGPPRVDEILPNDGAEEVSTAISIQVTFSEPVEKVGTDTLRIIDRVTQTEVPALVFPSITEGRARAILQPIHSLNFGREYEVVVGTGITDSIPNPPSDEILHLPEEYRSIFKTKIPQAYGMVGDGFTGWEIDLFTDRAEKTYAYVSARDQGWRIIDVTDPTKPVQVRSVNWTTSSVRWYFRGLDVDPDTGILAIVEDIAWNSGSRYGYIRFYDVNADPANPPIVGKEKLAEEFSSIPMRVSIYRGYAFVATVGAGIQVVDIEAAKADTGISDGSSIVGSFDTFGQGYGHPSSIKILGGGRAVITTTTGYLLTLDINIPQLPKLLSAFRPQGQNFARVGVASSFSYTDEAGVGQTLDLAITTGATGHVKAIDLTDPTQPGIIGTGTDQAGNPVFSFGNDITIKSELGLAFISTFNSLQIFDIKNPLHPMLITTVTELPNMDGNLSPLGASVGMVELDGLLYLANQTEGIKVFNYARPSRSFFKLHCNNLDYKANLNCTDYYPALEEKLIVLQGIDSNLLGLDGKEVEFAGVLPAGVTLTSKNSAEPKIAKFSAGLAKFYLKTEPTFKGKEVALKFKLINDNAAPDPGDWLNINLRVRNNSNVTLKEVLAGEAVFTFQNITEDNPCSKGETTGVTPDKQGFDFVQMMLGHILPPLRSPVDERNLETLVDVDGCYGGQTERAVKALIEGSSNAAAIRSAQYSTKGSNNVLKTAVSHTRGNQAGTMGKLVDDYSGLTIDDIGKVVGKEILIGLKQDLEKDKHPTKNKDVGIYELYLTDDWDGDGLSNYIEVENSNTEPITAPTQYFKKIIGNSEYDGNDGGYEGNYFEMANRNYLSRQSIVKKVAFDPLKTLGEQANEDSINHAVMQERLKAVARGKAGKNHGEMAIQGSRIDTGDYAPDEAVSHGMRIPDFNKGFYYSKGGDPVEDTDNYGLLSTIRTIEDVARNWVKDKERLVTTDAVRTVGDSGYGRKGSLGQRFGVGDLSMPGGRYFRKALPPGGHDHQTHRNGVDVDMRYVRKPECGEGRTFVNFEKEGENEHEGKIYTLTELETSGCYDLAATESLFKQFAASGTIDRIIVDNLGKSGLLAEGVLSQEQVFEVNGKQYTLNVVGVGGHFDHFHVRFKSQYGPAGEVTFSPTSLTLPALRIPETLKPAAKKKEKWAFIEANAVTITTSIIRDANDFTLFEGYPISVSIVDAAGKVQDRGDFIGMRKGKRYWTDEQGKLTIKYVPSTSAGEVFLQLWADGDRKIPLGKPLPIHITSPAN